MKKNVLLFTFANVFYNACTWLITVLVVHLATFEQAGYLSLAMSISSTCSTIALFNMRSFQITDVKHEFLTSEYVTSRIITTLVSIIICMIAAIDVNDPYQSLCINLYMIIKATEAVIDVFHGIDQIHERFDYIFVSCVLRGIAFVACFTVGLKLTGKLAVAILLIALVHIIIGVFYDIRKTTKLEEVKLLKSGRIYELLKKCIPLVVFMFCLSLINTLAKNVLGAYFGKEELGIYSTIASPTLVVQVFATVAFSPFLPRISELNIQKDCFKLQQMLNKVYVAFAGLALIVNIGAVLLGRWGLELLFGQEILANYNLFMPVVWVTVLYSVVFVLSQIMISFRKIKEIIIGMIMIMITFAVIVYPSMKSWGLNGASYSQIIAFLVFVPYMIFVCERHVKKEIEVTC